MTHSPGVLPETAKSRPALSSTGSYRYRFPRPSRDAADAPTKVSECAGELLPAMHSLCTCVRTLAGVLMKIGPFELKIELAHHLHHYAEATEAIRVRLTDLRVSDKTLDAPAPAWLHNASCELLVLDDPVCFVVCFRDLLVRPTRERLRAYITAADPLLDYPTVRALQQPVRDLDAALDWYDAVEEAAREAGDDPDDWASAIDRIKARVSPRQGSELEDDELPHIEYRRPHACRRDDRMPVFHQTRQYRETHLANHYAAPDALTAECVELFRVQRDELDAVETFANVLYDMRPPFELQLLLARIISDEARHAEMGQRNLERLGLDPFSVPCGVIGINVRSPLPPLVALAQISIFGELNQIGALRRLADRCYGAGQPESGHAFDFTHADELMHLRQVRAWLPRLAAAAGLDMQQLEEVARDSAIARLREEGVVGEDYANKITSEELSLLIGE